MNKFIKLSMISALLATNFACTDLDEEIKDNYTAAFDPENQGLGVSLNVNLPTPQDGLGGAFSQLANSSANHGGYFSIQEISSDEAVITQKGGDWFDGGVNLNLHTHNFTPTNDHINGAWTSQYAGIFQCNELLGKPEMTAAQKAQLRTLRAYFYWRLCDTFGRVKIVTAVGGDAPQATRAQVFDFVKTELLAAIPDLPAGMQAYGRLNKSGAYALLARLYLNAEVYTGTPMYAEAIAAADEVINSGLYSLDENYADVFAPDNIQKKEQIFVIPFDQATLQGFQLGQMTLHYPSQLTYRLKEQPWNGYSTLEEFYNSYEDGDERKANNFVVGPQYDASGLNPILDVAFDKADPDGAPINYTPFINELAPNGSRQAGARLGKFKFKQNQQQHMDNDYPLLRYGEVLLNKAEALARLNGYGDATALSLVNELRTRAGVAPFGSLTEGTLLAERGRELFIEGLRRSDQIRFGVWGNTWWEKPASEPYKTLFPIPFTQINASNGTLTQNPGY